LILLQKSDSGSARRLKMSDLFWLTDGLAAGKAEPQTIMVDATYLKAHRTASSLRLKKGIQAA